MHFSVPALLMAITARLLHVSEQSTWIAYVPIVNGNCVFQDKKIPVDQSTFLEKPCERWTCAKLNATHGYVDASGCSHPHVENPSCKVRRRKGEYPACCPVVDCTTSRKSKRRRHR